MEAKLTRANKQSLTVRNNQGTTTIGGHAAVFFNPGEPGTEMDMGHGVSERIMPGAFTKSLRKDSRRDILALSQHDSNLPLGRVSAGNLRLNQDKRGLAFEIDLPDTSFARDLGVLVREGIIDGASFGFRLPEHGSTIKIDGEKQIREINDVILLEVSPVTFPAYAGASVGMRALGEIEPEFLEELARWRHDRARVRAVDVRMADLIDR